MMIGLYSLTGDEILIKALIIGFKFQHNIHLANNKVYYTKNISINTFI